MARSEVNYTYEADTAFRAPGSAAITATAAIGEFALDKLVNVRTGTQRNKLGAQAYDVVIVVESSDTTTGDETYVFDVTVGPAGLAGAVQVGSMTISGAGQYVIKIDAHSLEKVQADHEAIGLNLTAAGTTPIITFASWVALGV